MHEAGDTDTEFTIQSVSKPFVFALAVDALGLDEVMKHVGIEPSGEPFNAISLEPATGRPLNPMINAGAIVTSSLMAGDTAARQVRPPCEPASSGSPDATCSVDEAVFTSEAIHRRSQPRARPPHPLGGHARFDGDVATTAYFRQCSISVNARDLAIMAATLATGGVNPITASGSISEDAARWTTAVMTSCGMYDAVGRLAGARRACPRRAGSAAASRPMLPGQFGIGTFSPRLDARGNSVRGVAMLERCRRATTCTAAAPRRPLSPIASLERDGRPTRSRCCAARSCSPAPRRCSRASAPFVSDDACLVLDFTGVTRVGDGSRACSRSAPELAGRARRRRRAKVAVRDPEGVLSFD